MDALPLNWLSATEAARGIRDGLLTSEQVTEACLARVREVDDEVQAWAFLDPAHALGQARARDEARREGRATGPLHGVPVGIKDIIDTGDMPTEDGTVIHAGRTPARDAAVVAMLRAAGAIILGKTVTTELATYAPGKTRNPHDRRHTPGGSSSGSAAAVAAGMVPAAVGTQTNGSVIRPAAFCGVYGFKPSFGLIPRSGVLKISRTLDHVGVFARTLADVALVTEQIVGYDALDPDTAPRARPPLVATCAEEPPLPPVLAYVKGPAWDRASDDTQEAFAELASTLADRMADDRPARVHQPGTRLARGPSWKRRWPPTSTWTGRKDASGCRRRSSNSLRAAARSRRSTICRRAAPAYPCSTKGSTRSSSAATRSSRRRPRAPRRRGSNRPATRRFARCGRLCGMPAISLPLMQGANGLPMGVQLVGRRGDDARLLRTARWLVARVESD